MNHAVVHGAFVPVVPVLVMEVPIMDVVHVVVVGDGCMAAIRAVHMGVARMRMVVRGEARRAMRLVDRS